MKFKVAAAICLGVLSASKSYASCPEVRCPLPLEEDDPEHMTVKAPRIPPAGPTIVDLGTVVGPPIYVASVDQVNASGKKKIEKAKKEAEAGASNFWTITTLQALLDWASGLNYSGKTNGKVTVKPDGTMTIEYSTCRQISVKTQNKDTCAQMEVMPAPNGQVRMEIRKLIAYELFSNQYRLGYSTNDTIVLVGDSIDHIISMIAEVDPQINQF